MTADDQFNLDEGSPIGLNDAIMAAVYLEEPLYLVQDGKVIATVRPGWG